MQPISTTADAYGEILPWTLPHGFKPIPTRKHDPYLLIPPPPTPYAGLFNRRPSGSGFGYESGSSDHPRCFGLHASAQEMMDAKALATSKIHSEAERRRRERINNHLAKLRSLLPNTTKTDKASLLAQVIQHLKELKRQTSLIAETIDNAPTEIDELTVDSASHEDGRLLIKASICCEDRSGLLPDLIKTLKALRLRALKAEIMTLGGRIKNVLFVVTEENEPNRSNIDDVAQQQQQQQQRYCITSIQEALKGVLEKSNREECGLGNGKRQRTNKIS